MRLSKWLENQKMMDFYRNKSQYLNWVDNVLVQICTYAKSNVDNSKSVSRKWNIDDFEIHNTSTIIPAYQDSICKKQFPSQLKEYGLYELFLQLLMPEKCRSEGVEHLSALDLPAPFQEFDTILGLLESNEPYDFWDFPTSVALVDLVDIETNTILKNDKVFIEEIDEIYVYPNGISVNGTEYQIIDRPQIRYSFIRRSYTVYVRRDHISNKKLIETDLGMMAFDNHNRRIFVPLKDEGTGSFLGTYTILPKAFLPYVSIALVLRNKNSKSTMIDMNEYDFTVLPEICVYLSNQNSQNVRNVRIAVSSSYSFGGSVKIEICVMDKDGVEAKKEVELQL